MYLTGMDREVSFFRAEVRYESELSKCKTYVEGRSPSKPYGMGQMPGDVA